MNRTIDSYMTATPHTVGAEQALTTAANLMKTHGIRHLPVLQGGELVGILSDRDLSWIQSLPAVESKALTVQDAMSQVPYTVAPGTPLKTVSSYMAEHRLGSALIVQGGHCVGIFTAVDACKALTTLLP